MSEQPRDQEQFDPTFIMAHFGSWLVEYGRRLDLPDTFFEKHHSLSAVHINEAERQGAGLIRLNQLIRTLVHHPEQMVAINTASRSVNKYVPGNPDWDATLPTHVESTRVLVVGQEGASREKLIISGLEMTDIGEAMGWQLEEPLNYDWYIQAQINKLLTQHEDIGGRHGAEVGMEVQEWNRQQLARLLHLPVERYTVGHAVVDERGYDTMTAGIQVLVTPVEVVSDGLVFYNNKWVRFSREMLTPKGHEMAEPIAIYSRDHESGGAYKAWDAMIGLFDIGFEEVTTQTTRRRR